MLRDLLVGVQDAQPAFELFQRKLVGRFFGLNGKDELRGQPQPLLLFALASEVEIEAGLDLGRDGFLTLAVWREC